jgi:hypothetical protein
MHSHETLIKAIEHYGERNQITQAIEELGELIVQLAKCSNERGLRIHLLAEIADASIMLEQLKLIFGATEVQGLMIQKLERLDSRIKEEVSAALSGAM